MIEEREDKVVRKAFFALLRAGLWGESPEHSCFPLCPKEWSLLYIQACRQTVEGVIYDGLLLLEEEYLPPRILLIKWTARIDAMERRNRWMNQMVGVLNQWFKENGIEAWLMKGQGIAAFYAQPLHRSCGDIDWFFPHPQDYEKAARLLKEYGVKVERQAGFSLTYSWNGFQVEHHSRLLDIHNPLVKGYLKKRMREEAVRPLLWKEEGKVVLLPSSMLMHVSVNAHILKHMLAFGIGIRQLCDSARVCHRFHDAKEGALLKRVYRKAGIYRWIQLLNSLLVKELGMPESCLPFPLIAVGKTDWVLEEIWQGGNFGFYDRRFGQEEGEARLKRKNVGRQYLRRMALHFRYAPWETCWFPVIQMYSRIYMKRKNDI